jgi:hypothetical protein
MPMMSTGKQDNTQFSPVYSFMRVRVYLVMLELRPPHRPLSLVTATVVVLGGSTAAVRGQPGG